MHAHGSKSWTPIALPRPGNPNGILPPSNARPPRSGLVPHGMLGAQTVAPRARAGPAPTPSAPTPASNLDMLAEQLQAELQLCDSSLNQLGRGSAPTASGSHTVGSEAMPGYASPSFATALPGASTASLWASVSKPGPRAGPGGAMAQPDASIVKRVVAASGQGCASILAEDLRRRPIPGVYWTTRCSRHQGVVFLERGKGRGRST